MLIHGLQKMTLLDYPGRVACTVFTAGCNFRCPFCHNARLVTRLDPDDVLEADEVLSFLRKRVGLLDGVAVTGGEPTLQPDLPDFLRRIKDMGYLVKLDTNGTNPAMLRRLVGEGLVDYVAMDVKNSPAKYGLTAGIPEGSPLFDAVRESIAFLLTGCVDYEFRTTVMAGLHTPEDAAAIGAWIAGAPRWFIQPFADSGELVGDEPFEAPSRDVLDDMAKAAGAYVGSVSLRGI